MTPHPLSLMEPPEPIQTPPIPELPPVEEHEPAPDVLNVIPTVFYVEGKNGEVQTVSVEDYGD